MGPHGVGGRSVAAGPGRSDLRRAWSAALATGPAWLPGLTRATLTIRPSRSRVAVATDVPVRVGDAALSVDPLSGHGLTLALEGAVRCLDPDQPAWLRAQAEEHADAARAAYAKNRRRRQ